MSFLFQEFIPTPIFHFIILALGLIFGSFMNVLIYRVPRGKNIVHPPSACPVCGATIAWYSNIPVISYVIQKGRCVNCKTKISIQYPLVELITGVVFFIISFYFNTLFLLIKYLIFAFLLLAAAFTDLDTAMDKEFDSGYIPDHYTIGGVLLGYIFAIIPGSDIDLLSSFAGSGFGTYFIFIVGYLYRVLRKIDGIGDGDALLLGMIGSFLGIESIIFTVLFGSILGVIYGVVFSILKGNSRAPFPFGPMLSFSALLYMFIFVAMKINISIF